MDLKMILVMIQALTLLRSEGLSSKPLPHEGFRDAVAVQV